MPPSLPRSILITGASSGIGAATAKAFLARGWKVHAAARRLERMQSLADEGAHIHALDLLEEDSIEALIAALRAEGGGLDALVNNAGIGVYGAVEQVPIAEARRQFEVNLFGLARLTQGLIPLLRERERSTLVNISSIGGRVYTPLGAWYHASKHALEGWSDCLRLELEPFGIRVVVVEPGAIETDFAEIAIAPLLERSAGGPYEDLAHKMTKATRQAYIDKKASSPQFIADQLVRIVERARPRTRYAIGYLAKPVLLTRHWFGDRAYDWLVRRFL